MKKLSILISFSMVVLISCNSKNSYTMETVYKETKAGGDSVMVTKNETISADSDSLAYLEAQKQFNELVGKMPNNNNGMPVSFLLKNSKGAVISAAGLDSTKDKESNMYPNQKSPD